MIQKQSLRAIVHHSLTNLTIVCHAIILVTVYYDAPLLITLAFVYIGLKARIVDVCTHAHTRNQPLPVVVNATLGYKNAYSACSNSQAGCGLFFAL